MRPLLLFALVALCLVLVECDKRRDVHRIVLKSGRTKHKSHSKKNSSRPKPQHYHNHDHESHSTSIHEETIIPSHHYHHSFKDHPTFHHEYRDLIKPRPPIRQELLNYPEEENYRQNVFKSEGEIQDYRFYKPDLYKGESEVLNFGRHGLYKTDTDGWAPLSKQNLIHHAAYESEPASSQTIPRKKKKTRKPIVDSYIEFTTSKPQFFQSDSLPRYYENFATYNKVQKGGNRPTRIHNSYEVHEETDEAAPSSNGFSNLTPITYSFRDNVLPTADSFSHDVTYGIKVNGGRKTTRRPY